MQDDLRNRSSYFGRLATQIQYDDDILNRLEADLTTLNDDAVNNAPVLRHLKTRLEELNSTLRSGGKLNPPLSEETTVFAEVVIKKNGSVTILAVK